jgi:hypothetical protein
MCVQPDKFELILSIGFEKRLKHDVDIGYGDDFSHGDFDKGHWRPCGYELWWCMLSFCGGALPADAFSHRVKRARCKRGGILPPLFC